MLLLFYYLSLNKKQLIMKKLSILVGLFLSTGSVFSQNPLTPVLSTNIVPINDFFGFNGQNTNETGFGYDNPAVVNSLSLVHASTLRFPGGTVANYWDWKNGNYIEPISPATGCFGLPSDFGSTFPQNNNTLANFKNALNKTSAKPIWTLNLLTDDLASQLSMLSEAKCLGLPVEYIELGNEFYLNNDCYEEKFPYAVTYGEFIKDWIPEIRNRFPNVHIACVGTTTYDDAPERRLNWNSKLRNYFATLPTNERPDAFTLHDYKPSGLGINNCSAINFGQPKCNSGNYYTYSSHLFGTVYNNFNQLIADDFHDINQGNNDYNYWITEYNLLDRDNNIHGSWAHALHTAEMTLLYLKNANEIELTDCHTLLGNGVFSAILNSNNGYDYSNSVSNPFCSPCSNNNATSAYTLSSLGLVMNEIGVALKNAVSVSEITFTGSVPVVTTNCSIAGNSNPGVISWLAVDPAGNTNVLFLNLSDISSTITDVNSNIFGGVNVSAINYKTYNFGLNDYLTDYNPSSNSVTIFNNTNCGAISTLNNIGIATNLTSSGIILPPFSITRAWLYTNNIVIKANSPQFCEGTDFLLTAITAPSASSFQWYKNGVLIPGATSQNYSGTATLANDIYSVSASLNSQTITSGNFSVNVLTKPVITIPTGLNQTVCNGSTITLGAVVTGGTSSNYYYNWTPGSNIDPVSSLTSNLNYTVSKTDDFTVYVSDGTCTSKEVIRVTVLGDYNFEKIPDRVCSGVPYEIELTAPSWVSATYLWSDGSTTSKFHLPNSVGPNYSVNINYSFSGGSCNVYKEFTSYQVDCCVGSSPLPLVELNRNSTVSSLVSDLNSLGVSITGWGNNGQSFVYTTSGTNNVILINTDFSPDVDLKLKNFTIKLTEGARIRVKPYRTLNLIDCKIESCGSTLWDGIIVEEHGKIISNTSLTTTSSEITDARNAVQLNDFSEYSIQNTKFKNNLIGLMFNGDIGKSNRAFGLVSGNTFFTDNSNGYIKGAYAGMTENFGGQAFSGINIENGLLVINTISPSGLNYFYNLSSGINARNSVLSIGNVRFKDIYKHPLVNEEWNSAAVCNVGYLPTIGTSSYTAYDNNVYTNSITTGIENTGFGIRQKHGFLWVKNEVMSSVKKGIYVSDVVLDTIVIDFNRIDALEEGITCYKNDGAKVIHVMQNTISVNNPTLSNNGNKMENWGIGIVEQGLKTNTSTTFLKCNNVTLNNANYGLYSLNSKNLIAKENSIFMNNVINKLGVAFFSTGNSTLTQNGVDGITGLSQQSRGFLFSMSTENDLINNSSNNSGIGFDFWNVNSHTNLIGNRIGSHYIGLHINKSGLIGPQYMLTTNSSNGNRWFGYNTSNGYGSGYGAVNENIGNGVIDQSSPSFSQFVIDNSNLAGSLFYPFNDMPGYPNSSSSGWFKPLPNYPPILPIIISSCSLNDIDRIGYLYSAYDSLIVQDNITSTEFGEEVQYITARDLFEILQNDSLKLLESEFYKNFYDSLLQTNIGEFGKVREMLHNIYFADSSLSIQNDELNSKISNNLTRLRQIQELLTEGTSSQFDSLNLVAEGKYLAYQIGRQKNEKGNLSSNFNLLLNDRIQFLIEMNDGISPNNLIEMNEKYVNDFLLKQLRRNLGPDSIDFSILQSIAQQCPFSGGRSVYVARAIIHEYYPEMVYSDEDICMAEGLMRKSNVKNTKVKDKIYASPNPSGSFVNLINENGANLIVRIDLLTLESKLLFSQNNSLPINIMNLNEGVYFARCLTMDGIVLTTKFIVRK
jgi:hypothetical protein